MLEKLHEDSSLVLLLHELSTLVAFELLSDFVDVLGLEGTLVVFFEHLGEVSLESVSSEEGENLLPVGRVLEVAEVGLDTLDSQDLESGGLSDTVGAHESEHSSKEGLGQSVEFEHIGSVTMDGLIGDALGQIDDFDGLEWALLHADGAPDAKTLCDDAALAEPLDLDAQLPLLVNWALSLALQSALLGLALLLVYDSNT